MDWTGLADGFVAVMQVLSGTMLLAGAAMWIREGLRGEDNRLDPAAGRRDRAELRQPLTGTARV
jgi:hypothetical protein